MKALKGCSFDQRVVFSKYHLVALVRGRVNREVQTVKREVQTVN